MNYKQLLFECLRDNEEADPNYSILHLTPSECFEVEDGTEWKDEVPEEVVQRELNR